MREADFARLSWVNPAAVQCDRILEYRTGLSVTILQGCATPCALLHVPDENEYDVEEGGTSEDRRFSLEGVRCLGACGLAPVMVIGPDTHGDVSSDKIIDILEKYELELINNQD